MFVNSGASDIVLVTLSSAAVEKAITQCTSRWAMARGHRLNTSIVLAAVHGLSGLFRAVSAVEPFTLSPPSHSVPVPNRSTRLCGRKATLNHLQLCPDSCYFTLTQLGGGGGGTQGVVGKSWDILNAHVAISKKVRKSSEVLCGKNPVDVLCGSF